MKKITYSILLTVVLILQVALMSSCGESETSAKKFEYEEINGGIRITKYLGSDKKVVVPSIIENKKVIEITDTVFSGNIIMQELSLPENISKVYSSYLNNCDSLKKLTLMGKSYIELPDSLDSLETLNLYNCTQHQFTQMRYAITDIEKLHELNIKNTEYIPESMSSSIPTHEKVIKATIPEALEKHISELTATRCYKLDSKKSVYYKLLSNLSISNSSDKAINVPSDVRSEIVRVFSNNGYSLNPNFNVVMGKSAFLYNGSDYFILTGKLDNGYNVEVNISHLFYEDNGVYKCYFDSVYAKNLLNGAVAYKEIDSSANMSICFCSRDVIVNGNTHKFDFK